jgi:HK97 family phage prohead protease
MPTLTGHFARYGEWARIDSKPEGRFMERLAPGAFARTIREDRPSLRVLFNHGKDPQLGDKVLGSIALLEEDADGVRYEVPLDTEYNRELIPGLAAGLYGASFRFSVRDEVFDHSARPSAHNPEGLPERTLRDVRLFELGPVTWRAYAGATAGLRDLAWSAARRARRLELLRIS